jgi:hypothetical protein
MTDKAVLDDAKKKFKTMIEARYMNQAESSSDKAQIGGSYFFKKLRF